MGLYFCMFYCLHVQAGIHVCAHRQLERIFAAAPASVDLHCCDVDLRCCQKEAGATPTPFVNIQRVKT